MVEDINVRNYRPTFVIDRDGVKRYQEAPMPVFERRDLVSEAANRAAIETSPM
jgi:peroxiredoxin